jgi:hypothetical protein
MLPSREFDSLIMVGSMDPILYGVLFFETLYTVPPGPTVFCGAPMLWLTLGDSDRKFAVILYLLFSIFGLTYNPFICKLISLSLLERNLGEKPKEHKFLPEINFKNFMENNNSWVEHNPDLEFDNDFLDTLNGLPNLNSSCDNLKASNRGKAYSRGYWNNIFVNNSQKG